ncbi:MAG TPA: RHS repeat-associated core domain-containing protein [Acidobacteriaceae bacterium]|nr:RHS repeat-associated core domain-containing protein [Acidobacteriaceae bacterium]
MTTTVTDLVVPAKGLAINIQRQYDSLNAGKSMDFGYGWSLGTNVDLSVDSAYNVTFTLNGQRRTFYFTPQYVFFFGGYVAAYTPESGLSGSLTAEQDVSQCPFGYVLPIGNLWQCASGGLYSAVSYTYIDQSGTQYKISASGGLQSIKDIGGNTLTITSTGITSSTGLSVPFVRDSSGRITKITDPAGNEYDYTYDSSGNLATVKYPGITQTSTYSYDSAHHYLSGTDFRGKALPTTAYFGPTDVDPNGKPLNGRLKSVTDALSQTTSYAYNLATNTTTITYPADGSGHAGTATMVYDSYGMLLSSTDPNGLTTTNTYNADHNLIAVTDPIGNKTTYTYDARGNRTSTTYPATSTSTNTTGTVLYNQNSEPLTSTDELGNTRTYNYDANSWPTSVTDSLGTLMSSSFNADGTMHYGAIGYDITADSSKESAFTYDTDGNRTSSTDALGRETQYVYNDLGQKTSMIEPYASPTTAAQATTTYHYDAFGHLTETDAPQGRTTYSSYDANGNKISDTDADGNITTYDYDDLNRLVTTTYPDHNTVTNTYDFRGNILTRTDQNGHVTNNVYDVGGRLTSTTTAYGTVNAMTISYTYDDDGRKLTVTDPAGHVTQNAYDQAGRLTSVTSGFGTAAASTTSYGYDDAGNRTSMTDGLGDTTAYEYDARKRLTKTTYADTRSVTNTYDGPGNLASVTDQAGNVVSYTYDAANQLATVTQTPVSTGNITTYGYDLLGNLGSVEDANSHTTINGYDLLSELSSKTLPDGTSVESRGYDSAGNLTSLTHFSGVQTTYGYDSLNRLTSRATSGETTVSFTYTATGKRHTMTGASGTTTYSYDSADRLTSKAAPAGTLSYTYDAAGNVASIASSNTNGASMSYTWDALNRLSTVVDNRLPIGSNTTTYTYDAASNLVTVTYPNGLQSTLSYDAVNRMTGLGTVTSSNTPVASYDYTPLGATGIRTQAAEAFATPSSGVDSRNVNWSYDNTYRLTQEQVANDSSVNGTVSYTLDAVGNRTDQSSSISGVPSISSMVFNADDLLTSETYDANGNTTSTGGKTFAYDAENHLVSMNSGAVTLVYDGDGNRVAKTVEGVTTQYLVDDLNPTGYPQVVEEVAGGSVQRTYTYGLQRIDEEQVISGSWTPSFYGYDGAGTVRQLTNASGAVTDTYNYDAFGNKLNSTGSTPNEYLYRGEQFDSDLGLYYLRARYYNPLTGRFLSRDPLDGDQINPNTLHKYLYANGDPVTGVDPSGRGAYAPAVPAPAQPPKVNVRAVVEYTLIVGTISLGAVEGVKAVGCAVNIAETVNALRTPSGSFAGIKVDAADCSANKDCTQYEEEIQAALEEVQARYQELLLDQHHLYEYACKNPKNPWTDWGSWDTHIDTYLDAQADLVGAIAAARAAGCPVSAEAEYWATKPPPTTNARCGGQ